MTDQPTASPAHDPVELMARALAGAAVPNPKRNALAWHGLGEAGRERFREQARRIVNPASRGECDHDSQVIEYEGAAYWACLKCGQNHGPVDDVAPDDLREQYAAAIRPNMLMGLQDAELLDEPGTQRINEWVDWIATELAAVRDTRVEELTARAEKAEAAIEQVRALATTARVATWQACTCDERPACGCPSRPVAWKLNPGAILDALDQPQEGQ